MKNIVHQALSGRLPSRLSHSTFAPRDRGRHQQSDGARIGEPNSTSSSLLPESPSSSTCTKNGAEIPAATHPAGGVPGARPAP